MTARAFEFETPAGPYWSVIDHQYETVTPADSYLKYLRFSRRLADSTCSRYAADLALYFTWCWMRSVSWDNPDMTAFQMWLRVTPGPNERRKTRRALSGPGGKPIRSDAVVDRISMVVCEMFRHLVAIDSIQSEMLGRLYEVTTAHDGRLVIAARRHRLRKAPRARRSPSAAPVAVVQSMLEATTNLRDFLLIIIMVSGGLRRGEVVGLRNSDMHLLPSSLSLGCGYSGPHIHIVPRDSTNGAVVKGGVGRIVPVTNALTQVYSLYQRDRGRVPQARDCDYVFVNLYKEPLGAPMKAHAVNELTERLSKKVGFPVRPHSLRHTFGTAAIETANIDVVARLMGHAWVGSTATYLHPSDERLREAVESSSISDLMSSDGRHP